MTNSYRITTSIVLTSLLASTSALYGHANAEPAVITVTQPGATLSLDRASPHPTEPTWASHEPIVTPMPTSDTESELAQRMSDALLGRNKDASPKAVVTPEPAPSTKTWRCGDWEDLWQGRGKARTCQWH